MSNARVERRYHCYDDCEPRGCPGHTAVFQFQSVTDSLHFSDGKGQEVYMQVPELGAFLSMLCEVSCGYHVLEELLKVEIR